MNQHASDAPQQNRDESPGQTAESGVEGEPDSAVVADLVKQAPIRRGSPFASDPVTVKPVDNFVDRGPMRYTAIGAVAASILVLAFAAAATLWFPAGGTLIAALGCVLSIFGLYSTYRITSAGLLAIHLSLFVVCYGLSLS
jgi:hypothetical protein